MQLEKLNIALAPGSAGWVALDLGFALGRHWFWRLFAAWAAVAAGADVLGLVFVPGTPRWIEPDEAFEILSALPPMVGTVGV